MCVCQIDVARVERDVIRQELKSQVLRLASATLQSLHSCVQVCGEACDSIITLLHFELFMGMNCCKNYVNYV